jgi:hypothetical protein
LLWKIEVGSLSDGVGNYSSGELHEHGDWRRMQEIQKMYLDLVLEKRGLGIEKGRKLERVVIGPRNEGNGQPSCGVRERRTIRGCLT